MRGCGATLGPTFRAPGLRLRNEEERVVQLREDGGRSYRYWTCDVFTAERFGGNPLAVLPEAAGLTADEMQRIAREFNYSETTFVTAPHRGGDRAVRIFTPTIEVPFAGHPNVGTAHVLAAIGELPSEGRPERTIVFEEEAGDVAVRIVFDEAGAPRECELSAPQLPAVGAQAPPAEVATALSLAPEQVRSGLHPPVAASVGLPFLVVEVADAETLDRCRVDVAALEALGAHGVPLDVFAWARADAAAEGVDLHARMFAPLDGVPEDPATGSASCALVGLLGTVDPALSAPDGEWTFRIEQGAAMGRRSELVATVARRGGAVSETRVGGASVLVAEGTIRV